MAKLTKKQRQEALAQSGQSATQGAVKGASIGGSVGSVSLATGSVLTAPVVAGIGAGIGAVTGGLGGYLRARKELLALQKMEKSQSKLNRVAEEAAEAEQRRQKGLLSQQFDAAFSGFTDPETVDLTMMQPGISGYDSYHARRYG